MTAIKREHSVHVRLSDEANALLELLHAADGRDKSTVLSEFCEELLLGKAHALRVAALRYASLGIVGTGRE